MRLFLGDGDSNVIAKLNEAKPYGKDVVIQKKDCVNHLRRNLRKKLIAIRKNRVYPLEVRKRISDESGKSDIVAHVNKAVDYWEKQTAPFAHKVENLTRDLKTTPFHVLGNHKFCR